MNLSYSSSTNYISILVVANKTNRVMNLECSIVHLQGWELSGLNGGRCILDTDLPRLSKSQEYCVTRMDQCGFSFVAPIPTGEISDMTRSLQAGEAETYMCWPVLVPHI